MKPPFGLLLGLLAAPALAGKVEAVAPANVDAVHSLEEIVIQGDRTLSAARQAIVDAEDRFYRRWNQLNDDRQYDISCQPYTRTGTRISSRLCQARFVADAEQRAADALMRDITGASAAGGGAISISQDPYLFARQAELKRRTLAMVAKDPELKRALLERARLEQHFEALRKEKFKDRWIVWD